MNLMTRFVLPLIASFAIFSTSQAEVIVDTGEAGNSSGYALNGVQYLGTQFSLDKAYTITGINGWMDSWNGGVVQMNLTSIVDGRPGDILYSADITIGARQPSIWVGASGLSWDVLAGTYAVTFIPYAADFDGGMGYSAMSPSGPMFTNTGSGWFEVPGALGLQVFGVSAAGDIPEPASLALMGIALAGLAASRRKQR